MTSLQHNQTTLYAKLCKLGLLILSLGLLTHCGPSSYVTKVGSESTAISQDANQAQPDDAETPVASTGKPAINHAKRADKLTTQKSADIEALTAKVPTRLRALMPALGEAALEFNVQPQLLVAISMQESTGGSDDAAYDNQGGMFQFTNEDTWRYYGTDNLDERQDDGISVRASANYMAALLNENNGDLAKALRAYNGPISQGANPNYIQEIYAKMAGGF